MAITAGATVVSIDAAAVRIAMSPIADASTTTRWLSDRAERGGSPSARSAHRHRGAGHVRNGNGRIDRTSRWYPGDPAQAATGRNTVCLIGGLATVLIRRTDMWDPDVYLAFADHRGRPFFDLLSRVGAESRAPGGRSRLRAGAPDRSTWPSAGPTRWSRQWTARRRWSPPPANAGSTPAPPTCATWKPKPDTDVVVSNAALQWVPEHAELLVRWTARAGAGIVDRRAGPRQLRDAVACHGARAGSSRTVRKDHARHTVSSRSGGPAAGPVRRTCSSTPAAASTSGRPPTCTSSPVRTRC